VREERDKMKSERKKYRVWVKTRYMKRKKYTKMKE
jgi:hypothetical protein